MGIAALTWCTLLTLALAAHMVKDAREFKKIERLKTEVDKLSKNKQQEEIAAAETR